MKKLMLAFVLFGIFLVPQVYAQPQGNAVGTQQEPMMQQKGMMERQGMKMGEGQKMQMMPMCMSMMKGMASHDMLMSGMLQAMKDIAAIQEKILKGVKPAEKRALLEDLLRLQGRVDQMMADIRQMTMHRMPGAVPEGAPSKAAPAPEAPHQH